MFRALIQILKASICLFILLVVSRWMLAYFGFSLEMFKDPATHTYDGILIFTGTMCALAGYSVGLLCGYIWGYRQKKTQIIYSDDAMAAAQTLVKRSPYIYY